MLVKNISQDLTNEISKRNWFSYWKHFKESSELYCCELNCLDKAEYGALVTKSEYSGKDIFVVGLCSCHGSNIENPYNSIIDLSPEAELIAIDKTL